MIPQRRSAEQEEAVARLRKLLAKNADVSTLSPALWRALISFSGTPFQTSGRGKRPGVEFTYTIRPTKSSARVGQRYSGEDVPGYGNELMIDRKDKSVTRATVEKAFAKTLEMHGDVSGPKQLGVFGASYIYAIFLRLGLIQSKKEDDEQIGIYANK